MMLLLTTMELTVGLVASKVTEEALVVVVLDVALPAKSCKLMLKARAPSGYVLLTVTVAV